MSGLQLSDERKAELVLALQGYFASEFDEDLSTFRAEELLAFVVKLVGTSAYNAGLQDARAFVAEKLEDLDASFPLPDDH